MDDDVFDMETSVGDDEDPDGNMSRKREVASVAVGRVALQVNLLEHPSQKETTVSPLKEHEKKNPRRDGDGDDDELTNPNAKSVLSFEESDRAQ